MVPDAEKSLEYFQNAGETDSTMEDATKLTIINSKKDYTDLLKSGKPVVVDFMASWCGKCSMIAPYIEELQVRYSQTHVFHSFVYVAAFCLAVYRCNNCVIYQTNHAHYKRALSESTDVCFPAFGCMLHQDWCAYNCHGIRSVPVACRGLVLHASASCCRKW